MKRILFLFAVVLVLGAAAYKGHHQKYGVDAEDTPAVRLLMQQQEKAVADKVAAEVAVRRAEQLKYQGMRMAPTRDAAGGERAFQEKIVAEFEKADPIPADRLKYFDWCLCEPTLIHVGWYGSIQRVNGDEVEIRIAPRFMSTETAIASVMDHCIETWKYSRGSLVHVKSVPGEDVYQIILGD